MHIASMEQVAAVERTAQRFETPCGDSAMVWRAWGDGSGGGTPVLLLHGGSGSWTHWVRNIDALVGAGRRVWIPDLPGFGESPRPPGGRDADAVAVPVREGLQQLLGDLPCDVVGFSFGAMVASFMALAEPARVARLVLVGAPALGIAPPQPILLRAFAHLPAGPARERIVAANLAALMLAQPDSIDAFAIALQEHNVARDRMRRRGLSRTDILLRNLPALHMPLHGIWGERDVLYVGRLDELEAALRHAPGFSSLRRIEGAGHWVQFESAQRFDAALLSVLTSSPAQ